jgi:hypothetical protein
VYYYIEEATRSTVYAASIKPFQRTKNGRGAFAAMLSQYAGKDKWRALIKESEDLMHRQRWKGQQPIQLLLGKVHWTTSCCVCESYPVCRSCQLSASEQDQSGYVPP